MGNKDSTRFVTTERFPSSSTLKPEFKLDSGSELDSDFPVMDDLIEIKLDDGCRNKKIKHHQIHLDFDFLTEEESLIEIYISSWVIFVVK